MNNIFKIIDDFVYNSTTLELIIGVFLFIVSPIVIMFLGFYVLKMIRKYAQNTLRNNLDLEISRKFWNTFAFLSQVDTIIASFIRLIPFYIFGILMYNQGAKYFLAYLPAPAILTLIFIVRKIISPLRAASEISKSQLLDANFTVYYVPEMRTAHYIVERLRANNPAYTYQVDDMECLIHGDTLKVKFGDNRYSYFKKPTADNWSQGLGGIFDPGQPIDVLSTQAIGSMKPGTYFTLRYRGEWLTPVTKIRNVEHSNGDKLLYMGYGAFMGLIPIILLVAWFKK